MPRTTSSAAAGSGARPAPQVLGLILVVLAAGFGLVSLIGWIAGLPLLTTFAAGGVPTAPSTALLLLLYGAAIFVHARRPQSTIARRMGAVLGLLGMGVSLLLLVLSSLGIHPAAEHLGMEIVGTVSGAPIGHMSPLTALCFAIASASFLALLSSSPGHAGRTVTAFCLASLLTLTSVALLLAYLFGAPVLHGSGVIPPALPTSLAMLMLGASLLVFAGNMAWPCGGPPGAGGGRQVRAFALIFILLAAGIVAAGYLYQLNYEQKYRSEMERQLSAIAELKADELVDWRRERLGDASILFNNDTFNALVRRHFDKPEDVEARDSLRTWLGPVQASMSSDRAILLDAQGAVRIAIPDTPEPVSPHLVRDAAEAMRSGKMSFVDFHHDAPDGPVRLCILVPIIDERNGKAPLGAIVFRIDPATYLYPFLSRWPTPSRTAETLLVRRDGEDVLFLNELRFRKNTALALRIPLTRTELPAVMAALGHEGIVEGLDYRGVPVIAAIRAVRDSPWFLTVRMDTSEVYGPLRERLWLMVMLVGVLLLSAGMGVGLVWRQQSMRFYREKSEAADALRKSNELFSLFMRHSPMYIYIKHVTSAQSVVLQASDNFVQLIGIPGSEMVGKSMTELFPPEVAAKMTADDWAVVSTGDVLTLDEEIDGRSYTTIKFPIVLGDETLLAGYTIDVTERKRAEEAFRGVQERLSLAISGTQVGMFDWDWAQGKMLWTETHEALFGYAPATTTTTTTEHDYRRWADRVHPDDLARVEGQMRTCARERRPFQGQYRIIWPDKSEHWIETKGVFFHAGDGDAVRMVGLTLDITDRMQAGERHSTVVKTAMDGFWVIDAEGRIMEANDALCQMTGYSHEELLRMSIHDLEEIEAPAETADHIRGIVAAGKDRFETRHRCKNGQIIDVEVSVTYMGGPSKLMFSFVRDITEHKRAEETLRESEERFRALVEAVTDYVYKVTVQDGRVVETAHGPGCLGVTGYSPEEFHTQPDLWLQMVHSENQPAVLDRASKLLSGLKVWPLEHRITHRNGETRWVRNTAVLRFDDHGQYIGYDGLIQDITEYSRLQDQFAQAQKMEAIGLLAGGVAHDFRNQLTVIKGFGEMLLRRSLVKEEGVDKLQEILKAADRSTLLTGHLLAFSRKQTLQPEQVDVTDLLADIGKAIPRLTGEDVRVYMNPCPTPCVVQIDPGKFQQAIINLVTNARDAMPKGGDLTIATSRRELDEEFLKKHPDANPGAYAAVAVTDTGSGMDEATLAKIFEPFFTTKEVGQGTGLGLAMVYGFVKQSGGIVEVESQPGKGSTFTLFFPEYKGHDKTRMEGGGAREKVPGGTETILVVEDEEPVRQMLVESLRESGYAVLYSSTAAEATTELERSGDKIDMLITDVVMPGGGGVDLAQTIQRTRPKMPVLYVSGYAERDLKKRGVTIDAGRLLTKPCSHETLLTKVRQLLDKPGKRIQ